MIFMWMAVVMLSTGRVVLRMMIIVWNTIMILMMMGRRVVHDARPRHGMGRGVDVMMLLPLQFMMVLIPGRMMTIMTLHVLGIGTRGRREVIDIVRHRMSIGGV